MGVFATEDGLFQRVSSDVAPRAGVLLFEAVQEVGAFGLRHRGLGQPLGGPSF